MQSLSAITRCGVFRMKNSIASCVLSSEKCSSRHLEISSASVQVSVLNGFFGDRLIIKRDKFGIRLRDKFVLLCLALHTACARAHERDRIKKQDYQSVLLAENVRDYKPDYDGTIR